MNRGRSVFVTGTAICTRAATAQRAVGVDKPAEAAENVRHDGGGDGGDDVVVVVKMVTAAALTCRACQAQCCSDALGGRGSNDSKFRCCADDSMHSVEKKKKKHPRDWALFSSGLCCPSKGAGNTRRAWARVKLAVVAVLGKSSKCWRPMAAHGPKYPAPRPTSAIKSTICLIRPPPCLEQFEFGPPLLFVIANQ